MSSFLCSATLSDRLSVDWLYPRVSHACVSICNICLLGYRSVCSLRPLPLSSVYCRWVRPSKLVDQAEVKDLDGKVVTHQDSSTITALKAITRPILNEKFKLQDIHILATVLDPIMKNKLPGMTVDGSQSCNWESESKDVELANQWEGIKWRTICWATRRCRGSLYCCPSSEECTAMNNVHVWCMQHRQGRNNRQFGQ